MLAPGTHLGVYEVIAPIGAGGMGEVYKAKDTRLDRLVAVKVLPAHVSSDPAFRERFQREARTIAALSHPHICAIHDVGCHDGTEFLVLELLHGETLATSLEKGPMSLDRALTLAVQIADALATAHRAGIIHRDLKPANVVLTKAGAKLLDFGLAKVTPAVVAASGLSVAPTGLTPVTAQGTILGTLQYMAPEQIEGQDVDARTDVFAFGCVLYEMLTGRKAFEGKSQASVIAAILERQPVLPPGLLGSAPPGLHHVLSRCLAKHPDDRWQSTSDLVEHLRWIRATATRENSSTPVLAAAHHRWNRLPWTLVAITSLLLAFVAIPAYRYVRAPAAEQIRFLVDTPQIPDQPHNSLAVSPDGRLIAFVAATGANVYSLYVRRIGSVAADILPGTVGAANPFWSPDSRYVAFSADGLLKKIDVSGGPPLTICDMPGSNRAGTWNADGTIIFASNNVLNRVLAAGGKPTPITALDNSRGEAYHTSPSFLPDGRHFVYAAWSAEPANRGIYVGAIDGTETKRLLTVSSKAVYAPPGLLLYERDGTLFAHAFNTKALELSGEPVRIAENVGFDPASAHAGFSVSANGVLIYRTGSVNSENVQLAWFDRTGKLIDAVGPPAPYRGVDVSPEGKRIVFHRHDFNGGDVWVFDGERTTTSRLTFDPAQENSSPIWSPDGTRVAFASTRAGKFGIYAKAADGTGNDQKLLESPFRVVPLSWSSDGLFILYWTAGNGTPGDLWVAPLAGDNKPFPLLQSRFNKTLGEISPDRRWLAYSSDETGRTETYIRPFRDAPGRWQVSINGGRAPRWRSDGTELYFLEGSKLMMAPVHATPSSVEIASPRTLFDSGYVNFAHSPQAYHSFAVSNSGERFLIPRPPSRDTSESKVPPITVIVNWTTGLSR